LIHFYKRRVKNGEKKNEERGRGGGQLGVEAATGTRTTKKQDANASVGLDKGTQTGESLCDMKIYVKTFPGKIITLRVNRFESVANLKALLKEVGGFKIDAQHLC